MIHFAKLSIWESDKLVFVSIASFKKTWVKWPETDQVYFCSLPRLPDLSCSHAKTARFIFFHKRHEISIKISDTDSACAILEVAPLTSQLSQNTCMKRAHFTWRYSFDEAEYSSKFRDVSKREMHLQDHNMIIFSTRIFSRIMFACPTKGYHSYPPCGKHCCVEFVECHCWKSKGRSINGYLMHAFYGGKAIYMESTL